jgi:hypothetical protein
MFKIDKTRLLNNGILSTLINGREIQRKVNSTRDSVYMSKDHSISSQDWVKRDTSLLSTETS